MTAMAGWLDLRLDQLLVAPRMWGSTLEAVEMQALLLIEARWVAGDDADNAAEGREVLDAYLRFVQTRFPGEPARPLFQNLAEGDYATLAVHLGDFRDAFLGRSARSPAPEANDNRSGLGRGRRRVGATK